MKSKHIVHFELLTFFVFLVFFFLFEFESVFTIGSDADVRRASTISLDESLFNFSSRKSSRGPVTGLTPWQSLCHCWSVTEANKFVNGAAQWP